MLEFTGLAERPEYLESDLESALLTHLQSFLLELGAGFCFEARQRRITVGRQHGCGFARQRSFRGKVARSCFKRGPARSGFAQRVALSISVAPPGCFGSKLSLNAAELPKPDAEFEEITEGEELMRKEKLKTKWAALEALVGDPKRIALVAADLVAHFEKRVEPMDGKAMIVCMSRAGAGSGVEGIGRVGAEIPLPRAAGKLDILFGRLHRKPLCVGGPGAAGRVSGKRTASQRVAKA